MHDSFHLKLTVCGNCVNLPQTAPRPVLAPREQGNQISLRNGIVSANTDLFDHIFLEARFHPLQPWNDIRFPPDVELAPLLNPSALPVLSGLLKGKTRLQRS